MANGQTIASVQLDEPCKCTARANGNTSSTCNAVAVSRRVSSFEFLSIYGGRAEVEVRFMKQLNSRRKHRDRPVAYLLDVRRLRRFETLLDL